MLIVQLISNISDSSPILEEEFEHTKDVVNILYLGFFSLYKDGIDDTFKIDSVNILYLGFFSLYQKGTLLIPDRMLLDVISRILLSILYTWTQKNT